MPTTPCTEIAPTGSSILKTRSSPTIDVTTSSPPRDVGGVSAYLAGCVMREGATLVARRPDGPRRVSA